jgi:hypothetical protein
MGASAVPHPSSNETSNERNSMSSEADVPRSLRDLELEVEAEGREWMRRRLEEKLQAEAHRHGGVFPPERTQSASPAAGADAPA